MSETLVVAQMVENPNGVIKPAVLQELCELERVMMGDDEFKNFCTLDLVRLGPALAAASPSCCGGGGGALLLSASPRPPRPCTVGARGAFRPVSRGPQRDDVQVRK